MKEASTTMVFYVPIPETNTRPEQFSKIFTNLLIIVVSSEPDIRAAHSASSCKLSLNPGKCSVNTSLPSE